MGSEMCIRDRHVIPLNSEEGKFSLNAILPKAYNKLYRKSGPNKMAQLVSILWEREQQVARSSLCFEISGLNADTILKLLTTYTLGDHNPRYASGEPILIFHVDFERISRHLKGRAFHSQGGSALA